MTTEATSAPPIQPLWQVKFFAEDHGPVETVIFAARDENAAASEVHNYMEYENRNKRAGLVHAELLRVVFLKGQDIEMPGFRRLA